MGKHIAMRIVELTQRWKHFYCV